MSKLIQCSKKPSHWHFDHISECPWCELFDEQGIDFFPTTKVKQNSPDKYVSNNSQIQNRNNQSKNAPQINPKIIGLLIIIVLFIILGSILLTNYHETTTTIKTPSSSFPSGVNTIQTNEQNAIEKSSAIIDSDGEMKLTALGDQSYYLGEMVILSGKNSASKDTYFFIAGPNLPNEGGMLINPQNSVINDQTLTFEKADVQNDNSFKYFFQTANLDLMAGTYKIYAISSAKDKNHLEEILSDDVSIVIKKPYIRANYSGVDGRLTKDEALHVQGSVEGTPSQIAIWVIGNNNILYSTEVIKDGNSFDHEFSNSEISKLNGDQFFLIVQHPMYNKELDVYPDNSLNPQKVFALYPNRDNELLKISGPSALQGMELIEALINAFSSPMIDDTYSIFQISF